MEKHFISLISSLFLLSGCSFAISSNEVVSSSSSLISSSIIEEEKVD